jgi:hypothetical protein
MSVAEAAGFAGPSSVQAYFNAEYDGPLRLQTAMRLAKALGFKGEPPIEPSEVIDLSELSDLVERADNSIESRKKSRGSIHPDQVVLFDEQSVNARPENHLFKPALLVKIPCYSADNVRPIILRCTNSKVSEVEAQSFNRKEIAGYATQPAVLGEKRDLYVLFQSGYSMSPRYAPGDPLLIDRKRPAAPGDDVVVHLTSDGEHPDQSTVLVKKFVARDAKEVVLEQFDPFTKVRVPAERVVRIERVVSWRECLGL